jgi:hypothetical protein
MADAEGEDDDEAELDEYATLPYRQLIINSLQIL